jgi:hypothetical protein
MHLVPLGGDEHVALVIDDVVVGKGLRLLHLVIDIEQLSAGGASVSGLRAKAGK